MSSPTYDEERLQAQRTASALQEHLTALAKGKECLRCGSAPRVGFVDGIYKLVCNCEDQDPVLIEAQTSESKAVQRIVERALANPDPQVATLTILSVKEFFCKEATDNECELFVRMCNATGLNPYLKDVFLTKPAANKPAAIIIAAQAYRKWASHNPMHERVDSGVIVRSTPDAAPEWRDGALVFPGEELLGGWANIHKKGSTIPLKWAVDLQSFMKTRWKYDDETPDKLALLWANHPAPKVIKDNLIARGKAPQATWSEIAPSMIVKCAEKQGLERAYPEDMSSWLQRANIKGVTVTDEIEVIEGEVVEPQVVAGQIIEATVVSSERVPDGPPMRTEPMPPVKAETPPPAAASEPAPNAAPAAAPAPTNPVRAADPPPWELRDKSKINSVGALFTACQQDFNIDSHEVLRILGFSQATDIVKLVDSYDQVVASKT